MLKEESLIKLIDIYKSYNFISSLIKDKRDIYEIINILLEIPFFSDIKREKGYIVLKKIVNNMNIKLIPENTIVYLNNEKEHKCYILLYGITTKEEIMYEQNRSILGKMCKCITNSYFGVFESHFYINNILSNVDTLKKNFMTKIRNFKVFSNIFTNHYNKLFLNYDEESYFKNEMVYRENDKINGVYLILEGEFQLYKKGKQKSEKNEMLKNKDEINDLKKKTKLLEKIIFGDGQKVLFNKNKIIEQTLNSSKENSTNISFYLNKVPYSLIKLKAGDMFGDLEIIQKFNKRKLSVKATGMNNKVWFFPKRIVEEILIKINNTSFQTLSISKYNILKKQFNKIGFIESIRQKYNINNINFSKREKQEDENKTNNYLKIKKIKLDKKLLNKSRTLSSINNNKSYNNNFSFVTQKRDRYNKILNSSSNIRKKILNYLDNKNYNYNTGFTYHNFSSNNSFANKDSAYSLLTEKRIVKKKEFVEKHFRKCYSTLHKNQEKIKFFKINKYTSFTKKSINDFNSFNNDIIKNNSHYKSLYLEKKKNFFLKK